ncbi:hypothetical protein AHAS_Ahas17G0107000 [Arachis hypogaea]
MPWIFQVAAAPALRSHPFAPAASKLCKEIGFGFGLGLCSSMEGPTLGHGTTAWTFYHSTTTCASGSPSESEQLVLRLVSPPTSLCENEKASPLLLWPKSDPPNRREPTIAFCCRIILLARLCFCHSLLRHSSAKDHRVQVQTFRPCFDLRSHWLHRNRILLGSSKSSSSFASGLLKRKPLMFTNDQRQQERTGKYGSPRFQYLQELVSQFQNTADEEAKERILANLANFAYDPYNYNFLRQLNILELFLDCMTEPNEKLVEFGVGGICNSCADQANIAIVSKFGGIPLIIQCLSSPVRNTVNYALGALYYVCNESNKEEILKPEVIDAIKRYAAAEEVSASFSNLAKAFLDKHLSEN